MNVYFLVEGKTERKVYPKWISYFIPELTRVGFSSDVVINNYFLISGGGFPSILDVHLTDSVNDINSVGSYDYLVLVIDTDNFNAEQKIEEVNQFVFNNHIQLIDCELVVIPQMVCMETWLLGNKRIYVRNSSSLDVVTFSQYYNISNKDPELMKASNNFSGSIGDFHYQYLKTMLREKNIRYSKSNPKEVGKKHYIDELKNRLNSDKNSLQSMRKLFDLFENISDKQDDLKLKHSK